jgi:hypothetical protein
MDAQARKHHTEEVALECLCFSPYLKRLNRLGRPGVVQSRD